MNSNPKLDMDFVRSQFPSLKNDFILMDNAGGSQTLGKVIERIGDYLTNYNVQLGASYKVSAMAGKVLNETHAKLAGLINAKSVKEVIVGSSTTMLLRILSICLSEQWKPGDEVIVSNSDHEANVSCWVDLQKKGIVVKIWKVNPETFQFELDDLKELLSGKTKLVAVVHASNFLGLINPVKKIAEVVHRAGALICVDGVAYAPHRLVDVQAFDVDFYVFSTYKTYGPHQAILWGKYELLAPLNGLNHYFIGKDEIPYKFQPGNFNYELTYSLAGIPNYLLDVYDHHFPASSETENRAKFSKVFDLMADHEELLANHLLDYLNANPKIKIIGLKSADKNKRVPTISFIHKDYLSSEVVEKVDAFGIGIRFGDFYAKKLIHDLGLEEKDGVIRVSLVHYNTIEEVDQLIKAFEEVL